VCKHGKEFAGDELHHIVGQSDNVNVFYHAFQDLEDTVWEIQQLAVGQVWRKNTKYPKESDVVYERQ